MRGETSWRPWYRLVARPFAPRLVCSNLLARLAAGAVALALVLFLEDARDSFAVAGMVTGAYAFGTALGSPLVGRLIDKHGQTRILLAAAAVHAGSLALVLAAATAPIWALLPLGFAAGSSRPPLPACMRSLWIEMLPEEADRRLSYRLESILLEVGFIAGPAVTGLLVAFASPAAALVAAAVFAVVPTVVFALAEPSRRWRGRPVKRGLAGPLRSGGLVAILGSRLAIGVSIGCVQVGSAGFAAARGHAGAAGALLSAFAVGSLLGGLLIKTAGGGASVEAMYVRLSVLFGLGLVPLTLSPGLTALLALFVVAGLCLAPLNAVVYELTDRLALPGTETEARIWTSTAVAAGSAAGSSAGGWAIDLVSARAAFALAAAAGGVAALVSVLSRASLVPSRAGEDDQR